MLSAEKSVRAETRRGFLSYYFGERCRAEGAPHVPEEETKASPTLDTTVKSVVEKVLESRFTLGRTAGFGAEGKEKKKKENQKKH